MEYLQSQKLAAFFSLPCEICSVFASVLSPAVLPPLSCVVSEVAVEGSKQSIMAAAQN